MQGILVYHVNMEANESKWVNSNYILYGVESLWLGGLYVYSKNVPFALYLQNNESCQNILKNLSLI